MIYNGMAWYGWVLRKKRYWEEVLLIRQREVLFRWIEKKGGAPFGAVAVVSSDSTEIFCHNVGKWRPSHENIPLNQTRFILCSARFFPVLRKRHHLSGDWWKIYGHSYFEVWESGAYYEERGMSLPLRSGLSHSEKTAMICEVRRMMGEVLIGHEPACSLDWKNLADRQDLDIAVWVHGRLRASVIMIGQSCREALEAGACRATWDKRFLPILLSEVPAMRIEITLMSDLIFPIFEMDFGRNDIDPTKGYTVISGDGTKRGWYLPEVHNCLSFRTLQHLLSQLALEKSKIHSSVLDQATFGQFATVDFIEDETGMLVLSGPTQRPEKKSVSVDEMRGVLDRSVAWLCRMQREDGSIPAIISSGKPEEIRLSTLGCVGHALAVVGKRLMHKEALLVAEKIWQYMHRSFQQHGQSARAEVHSFGRVYFLRLSLALGKEIDGREVAILWRSLPGLRGNPILWLQVLSFFSEWQSFSCLKSEEVTLLYGEAEAVYDAFCKKRDKRSEQIALYPEYIALCRQLFLTTGESKWRTRGLECSQWYIGQQQPDGSLPHSPGRMFSYTRGSSKVFEALACFPTENREALKEIFAFLKTMEYTERNTFFFTVEEQRRYVGGFRHDAFNREAWIDATAHVMLGIARILDRQ